MTIPRLCLNGNEGGPGGAAGLEPCPALSQRSLSKPQVSGAGIFESPAQPVCAFVFSISWVRGSHGNWKHSAWHVVQGRGARDREWPCDPGVNAVTLEEATRDKVQETTE